jgi:GTP-binding protein
MLVAASKMDALQDGDRLVALRAVADRLGLPLFEISSVTGQGIEALKFALAERVLAPLH